MTNSETFSVIIQYSRDLMVNSTQLRVIRTDTGEEVNLRDATFLVRILIDRDTSLVRCFVRHLTSGREAHLQSTLRLQTFILSCLLEDDTAPGESTTNPSVPEEPT